MSSNTNISIFIPNDIIVEILSRIPAKSLLRLRWACKYWFNLITRDHDFVKMHLQHHHTRTTNDDGRIINNNLFLINTYAFSPVVYTMNFNPGVVNNDDGEEAVLVNLDYSNFPLSDTIDECYFECCGSCNGLILLLRSHRIISDDTYFLWNPCTRELKELFHEPSNTYPVNVNAYYVYIVLGFGYDHTMDDYKVMRIIFDSSQLFNYDASIHHLNMELGVYTLRSNSWSTKIITDPLLTAYLGTLNGLGLLVNGALHWMMKMEQGIRTIMSFDITKEELQEIEGPDCFSDFSRFSFLSVFDGCLCICQETFDDGFVIWMMKDYGVKDSWIKLININMKKVMADHFCLPMDAMEPFTQYCKHGGTLMVFKTCIIVACDSKKNEARFMYSFGDLEFGYVAVANYIESLVSLNSGKYSTFAGSRTITVQKQDLLEYEVVKGCLRRTSVSKSGSSSSRPIH